MKDVVPMGLFWITLALINAGLAEQKDRSRWNWFLLSLLLGPIATWYIVATPKPAPRVPDSVPAAPAPGSSAE
ncbi:hypothetical protein [Leucobacter chromiireducens]|uniref:hypothetical protein n=1 Tax=Leucobacter chromiireducens TaxID=283877 RepID=UPI000F6411C7|nr:hypothetical protein [Leucobacter chromiireducens]